MAQVISTRGVWRTTNDAPTERDRLRRNEHGCGRIEHVRNTARSVWCSQFRLSQALLLPRLTSGRSRRADKWVVGPDNDFSANSTLPSVRWIERSRLARDRAMHGPRRGEGLFRGVFLFPFALSFVVTGTIWRWLLQPGGGVNVLPTLVGLPRRALPGSLRGTRCGASIGTTCRLSSGCSPRPPWPPSRSSRVGPDGAVGPWPPRWAAWQRCGGRRVCARLEAAAIPRAARVQLRLRRDHHGRRLADGRLHDGAVPRRPHRDARPAGRIGQGLAQSLWAGAGRLPHRAQLLLP